LDNQVKLIDFKKKNSEPEENNPMCHYAYVTMTIYSPDVTQTRNWVDLGVFVMTMTKTTRVYKIY